MVRYLGGYFLSFVVFLMITPSATYATHETDKIAWQLVVISNEPACSISHYELGNRYQAIIEEYFLLYGFNSNFYKPECYPNEKFDWKYKQPDDLDLLILLYDRDLGRELIHPLGIGGLYAHSGSDITHNHTIIFCDCSSFKFSDTNWIISHEISHFILNYLGYDLEIIEKDIHEIDAEYDKCIEEKFSESCKTVGEYLDGERLNHRIKVMKPYEPAIGQKFYEDTTQLKIGTKEFELLKEISTWWAEERITDEQYSESLKILTGKNLHKVTTDSFLTNSKTTIIVGEPPKDKNAIIENSTKRADMVLDTFPFIEDWNPEPIMTGEYPEWFKTRTSLWANGEITDSEFSNSIEMLEKSIKTVD